MRHITVLAALSLMLVACAPDGAGPAPPDDEAAATIIVENIEFDRNEVTIAAGETVIWQNNDTVGHTVTHGEQGQPVSDPLFDEPHEVGESFSYTFDEPGEYPITCTIHPTMNMTVIVD